MLRPFIAVSFVWLLLAGPALPQAAAPTPPPPASAAPSSPAPLKPGDPFGEPVELPERSIVFLNGQGTWDSAFDTLVDAFKSLNQYLDRQGMKPNGRAMTIYTETSDAGFKFRAALPIDKPPKNPPKGDIGVGNAPSGKALKFVHRGSFDSLDTTYEAITNHLDEKRLEIKEMFIEEYEGDPAKLAENDLVVTVFVPLK
ncbi:MAG: GyrI-like domain-containing protein [Pseudolabrys sp.]|nr:GyrI-like domain-containing protein [Pseudolabrys sp.]